MRQMLYGDLSAAARVLLLVPQSDRKDMCRQLLLEAEMADRYVKRFGRFHTRCGNGSLLAAARRHPMLAEPSFSDPLFCATMMTVLTAFLDHKREKARLGGQPFDL